MIKLINIIKKWKFFKILLLYIHVKVTSIALDPNLSKILIRHRRYGPVKQNRGVSGIKI